MCALRSAVGLFPALLPPLNSLRARRPGRSAGADRMSVNAWAADGFEFGSRNGPLVFVRSCRVTTNRVKTMKIFSGIACSVLIASIAVLSGAFNLSAYAACTHITKDCLLKDCKPTSSQRAACKSCVAEDGVTSSYEECTGTQTKNIRGQGGSCGKKLYGNKDAEGNCNTCDQNLGGGSCGGGQGTACE